MTQRVLTRDSSWLVFVLGIVLNLPGVWYLIALKDIGLSEYSDTRQGPPPPGVQRDHVLLRGGSADRVSRRPGLEP